jgi:cell wall-associated NlpC family hydrolase
MTSVSPTPPADPRALSAAPIAPPAPPSGPSFAAVLAELRQETALGAPLTHAARTLAAPAPPPRETRPLPTAAAASGVLSRAQALVGTPYVWGGNSVQGLDCSAYVSRAWGMSRQTTETLAQHAHPITKDQLQAGDAMNLTVGADPDGYGHVRLFDRWADPGHTKMWVYEATPPKVVHHVISYDPAYQPLRRN